MYSSMILQALRKQKSVVVVRGSNKEMGLQTALACIEGGLKAIEVAYTNASAHEIIQELTQRFSQDSDVLIGAGTVLDATTARDAIRQGACYIVSPSFSTEVAKVCHLYNIPYIPGCMTVTEMTTALEAGCEMVKLFPGSAFGTSYIAAVKAPLPQVSIMVTGGVNLSNAVDWFNSGVDAIGIGGEFNRLAAKGDFEAIREMAYAYAQL